MTTPFAYEQEGYRIPVLSIWDGEVTRQRAGDDMVFCFRPQLDGRLSPEGLYAGNDLKAIVENRAFDGTLRHGDIFVVEDSRVYTRCEKARKYLRERDPEKCQRVIDVAKQHRSVVEIELAPREFDWAQGEFTPALAKGQMETGTHVDLAKDLHGQIVATNTSDQRQEQSNGCYVVVERDIQDGQLVPSGKVIQVCDSFEKAQEVAVEKTNERRWEVYRNRDQKQAPEISRSR